VTPWRSRRDVRRTVLLLATAGLTVALLFAAGRVLSNAPQGYLFGLIGNDGTHLREERAAGIEAKLFALSWREYYPTEGERDDSYVQRKKRELESLHEEGFEVILSLGYHDTPPWVHENYEDTYYVNQLGERYTGTDPLDNGDANLVFNPELRGLVGSYMEEVFSEFGDDFYAVRLGGGRYGELTYPPASYEGESNMYWAYDANAQESVARAGAGNWRPRDASANGEAGRFLGWYLDSLVEYQNWQVSTLREGYDGRIMMLYPSWGIRPGQAEAAVEANLDGSTSAEQNGEVQRGLDFERQVRAIEDEDVLVTTTWLDADASGDARADPRYWSPAKYLSSLADDHPLRLRAYGENTGRGDREAMELSASQMRRYGFLGMAWYNEEQLFSGRYATPRDYERVIDISQQEAE
jgi:hypothetical protein